MPIILPSSYNRFTIIGIDPGVNNFGISIYNMNNNEIIDINAFTLINAKIKDLSGLNEETNSDRIIKIRKIQEHFKNILYTVNPILVVCESPFYNPSMPNAYASLVQIIEAIQLTCIEFNNNIIFTLIEPLLMKKTIGAGMMTGKIDVKLSVTNTKNIMEKLLVDINILDEHSIDAIAITYSYLKINNIIKQN